MLGSFDPQRAIAVRSAERAAARSELARQRAYEHTRASRRLAHRDGLELARRNILDAHREVRAVREIGVGDLDLDRCAGGAGRDLRDAGRTAGDRIAGDDSGLSTVRVERIDIGDFDQIGILRVQAAIRRRAGSGAEIGGYIGNKAARRDAIGQKRDGLGLASRQVRDGRRYRSRAREIGVEHGNRNHRTHGRRCDRHVRGLPAKDRRVRRAGRGRAVRGEIVDILDAQDVSRVGVDCGVTRTAAVGNVLRRDRTGEQGRIGPVHVQRDGLAFPGIDVENGDRDRRLSDQIVVLHRQIDGSTNRGRHDGGGTIRPARERVARVCGTRRAVRAECVGDRDRERVARDRIDGAIRQRTVRAGAVSRVDCRFEDAATDRAQRHGLGIARAVGKRHRERVRGQVRIRVTNRDGCPDRGADHLGKSRIAAGHRRGLRKDARGRTVGREGVRVGDLEHVACLRVEGSIGRVGRCACAEHRCNRSGVAAR